jgi:hypothetical protein
VPEMFIKNFDDMKVNFLELGQENQEDSLQRITEKTCEVSHKFRPRGAGTRTTGGKEETLKKRRLAQKARLRSEECAEQMGLSYKKSRKKLRLAIFRSKRLA